MLFTLKTAFYKSLMLFLRLLIKLIPQPQPLLFSGRDSSLELTRHLCMLNKNRVLIVTDKVIHELGLLTRVCQVLEQQQLDYVIFDEVEPDPSDIIVNRGAALLKSQECDTVLGIGGGSSLDAAKMIAVLGTHHQPLAKLTGILKLKRHCLPLFLIPTTAGTGSEVTMAAVITDSSIKEKALVVDPKMMASAAALDPVLMQGIPAKITADTGLDALTHAIEAYLSTHAVATTDDYAVSAIRMIFQNLPLAYQQGDNLDARQAMALASTYAGLAFTKAGLGYVHGIAHQLGAKYHIPHGHANALVLPHVLDFSKRASQSRLANLARAIGLGSESHSEGQLAEAFIQQVRQLKQQLDMPEHLPELNQADISQLAKAALREAHYLYPVPRYMDPGQCQQLISRLLPAH